MPSLLSFKEEIQEEREREKQRFLSVVNLENDDGLCDIEFRCLAEEESSEHYSSDKPKTIGSNKARLKEQSGYFRALWISSSDSSSSHSSSSIMDKHQREIMDLDCTYQSVRALTAVAFGQFSEVNINVQTAPEFLFCAMKYECTLLQKACERFIRDTMDNNIHRRKTTSGLDDCLALIFGLEDCGLFDISEQWFRHLNIFKDSSMMVSMLQSDWIIRLNHDRMIKLISSDFLDTREEIVFDRCRIWCQSRFEGGISLITSIKGAGLSLSSSFESISTNPGKSATKKKTDRIKSKKDKSRGIGQVWSKYFSPIQSDSADGDSSKKEDLISKSADDAVGTVSDGIIIDDDDEEEKKDDTTTPEGSVIRSELDLMRSFKPLIRFPLMSLDGLIQKVRPMGLLSDSEMLAVLCFKGGERSEPTAGQLFCPTEPRQTRRGDSVILMSCSFDATPVVDCYLETSEHGKVVTHRGMRPSWQTIVCTQEFTQGKVSFEVEIGPSFPWGYSSWHVSIGVVKVGEHVPHQSCLGNTAHSWAYLSGRDKGASQHGAVFTEVRSSVKQGSVVRCQCDLDSHTLLFFVDGKPSEVRFSDLSGPVRPAVSLFEPGAQLTLR